MKQYLDLLQDVLDNGELKENRTGVDTLSIFSRQLRFNLNDGFPLMTTKRVYWTGVAHELLWFISGNTNIKYLQDNNVHIWDEWADTDGNLGPVYGRMWRRFPHNDTIIDQLQSVIDRLRTNPNDRRLVVSAWNPALLPDTSKTFGENVADGKQALPPCHYSFQFVHINGKLNLIWNQRSVDVFLGLPFNIASYGLLLKMVAHITNLQANELVFSGADVHLYTNHIDQAKEQLSREPRQLPKLSIVGDVKEIDDFTIDNIQLSEYNPHSTIKAPVAA